MLPGSTTRGSGTCRSVSASTRQARSACARCGHASASRAEYVLWTGTVEPRKNLPGLLRAFARVEPAIDLALVGPSGWSEDLERVLGSLPATVSTRVHPLGWVARDDLAALYQGASVFCFPSLLEGFGFPVVEAMAHGTPVVTSTGTSTEELVANGAGLAVTPTDADAIADAISRVLTDDALAARLVVAGRSGQRVHVGAHRGARRARLRGGRRRAARRLDLDERQVRICRNCSSTGRCARSKSGANASVGFTASTASAAASASTRNAFVPRESQPAST